LSINQRTKQFRRRFSMKPRFLFGTLGLVTVLLITSCAPAPAAPVVDSAPPVSAPTEASAPQPEATAEPAEPAPTQAAEVQPIPTSRGPKLEATDPATVSLASGQLQLVEFFRFT
jgi:hypothetical protein